MQIDNSFNNKGLGINQNIKLSEKSNNNQKEKSSLLDKFFDVLSNKYLWLVIAIVLALIFGLNVLE